MAAVALFSKSNPPIPLVFAPIPVPVISANEPSLFLWRSEPLIGADCKEMANGMGEGLISTKEAECQKREGNWRKGVERRARDSLFLVFTFSFSCLLFFPFLPFLSPVPPFCLFLFVLTVQIRELACLATQDVRRD